MHDGAFSHNVLEFLNVLTDRCMRRGSPHLWLPRSPEQNSPIFLCVVFLKSSVYRTWINNLRCYSQYIYISTFIIIIQNLAQCISITIECMFMLNSIAIIKFTFSHNNMLFTFNIMFASVSSISSHSLFLLTAISSSKLMCQVPRRQF